MSLARSCVHLTAQHDRTSRRHYRGPQAAALATRERVLARRRAHHAFYMHRVTSCVDVPLYPSRKTIVLVPYSSHSTTRLSSCSCSAWRGASHPISATAWAGRSGSQTYGLPYISRIYRELSQYPPLLLRLMYLGLRHRMEESDGSTDIYSAVQKMPVRMVAVSCFKRGAVGHGWPAATVISPHASPKRCFLSGFWAGEAVHC